MKRTIILLVYILGIFAFFYYDFFSPPRQEQFVSLASSFLQGKLYFLSPTFDAAINNGHYYWPLGPFPAILLMPFVYVFGNLMKQGYLLFFLNLLNIFLLVRITKKLTGNIVNSLVISFAILFSTAYLGIALTPWAWYYAQTVGFTLTLLALEAYFFNRSWIIIGTFIALAYATRISLIFTALFFVLNLLYSDLSNKLKVKNLALLTGPIIISIAILGFYNFARFGNPAETGYSATVQPWDYGPGLTTRTLGLWSLVHIPTNLYYMFLKMPEPIFIPGTYTLRFPYLKVDGSAISILFTSSIFIWILFSNWQDKKVKLAGLTALIMIFVLCGSFSNGSWQYGYRYAIDYYPFIFIILIYSFKKEVSYKFLAITAAVFLINLYFINTLFHPNG